MSRPRRHTVYACFIALLALLAGCATPPAPRPDDPVSTAESAPAKPGTQRGSSQNYATVRVFFGTDRTPTDNPEPAKAFSAEPANAITWGSCDVSIPRDHRMGEREAPSIWRLEFRPDPEKHVVLLSVARKEKDSFFRDVVKRARAADRPAAFVFIHGYNVGFESAARRTAQMSYDLGFEGAALFYSWPSRASLSGYQDDEQTVLHSEPHIKAFLADIATRLEREDIYLIAHSMGNRPTSRALAALLSERPELRARFKEIMLVAPDVDADVFKKEIAPRLAGAGQRITLYASSNDLALKASKFVHGGQRLGDSSPAITVLPGIESIDASGVATDFLGHSYFAEPHSVLADLFEVVRDKGPARQRSHLLRVSDSIGEFFRFKKTAPQIPAL